MLIDGKYLKKFVENILTNLFEFKNYLQSL